jgi:hypothetical protein
LQLPPFGESLDEEYVLDSVSTVEMSNFVTMSFPNQLFRHAHSGSFRKLPERTTMALALVSEGIPVIYLLFKEAFVSLSHSRRESLRKVPRRNSAR